jgi:hypothetical protein
MADLSRRGHKLRTKLAEAGVEVTPSQLADAIDEALVRVGHGPCSKCGRDEELRYGMCFDCVFPPGTDESADKVRADMAANPNETIEDRIRRAGGTIIDMRDNNGE